MQLSDHVKTHRECPYCHKTYRPYHSLLAHFNYQDKKAKTGKNECEMCKQVIQYKCQLSKHSCSCTLEKHNRTYRGWQYCHNIFCSYNEVLPHLNSVDGRQLLKYVKTLEWPYYILYASKCSNRNASCLSTKKHHLTDTKSWCLWGHPPHISWCQILQL